MNMRMFRIYGALSNVSKNAQKKIPEESPKKTRYKKKSD